MKARSMARWLGAAFCCVVVTAFAADLGSPKEARAMLQKAVAEVKKDKAAAPGRIKEVKYMWPKPGQTEPVQKISYVTKVGDQVCGVGFYR